MPPRRNQWGHLYTHDIPDEVRADPGAYAEYRDTFFKRVREARREIAEEIEANPDLAAARFARYAIRCCCCGKVLHEKRSKTYGIGPECRRRVSPAALSALIERTRAAYGESILRGPEET